MARSRRIMALAAGLVLAAPGMAADYRARLPQDEVIYFLLPDRFDNADPANDRGGLSGDRLATGFDPADKGFYHGGDLKGVTRRLDYIAALGATAVWVAPIFGNKAVQGPAGHESAGYHGYWITDFDHVDPHLGSDADFAALIAAAHARGLKVYMDIVVNHTADVIKYRECPAAPCPYRSRADYPYQRRGGVGGPAINAGFAGDDDRSAANFAKLTDPTYAYTPYIPAGEAHAKTPDWLERRHAVPQPRRLDLQRRKLDRGRLRRSRRRDDAEPARRRRDDRDLRRAGSTVRRRRLPHRHRAPRRAWVLAGVRAGDAGPGQGPRHPQLPHLRRGRRPRRRRAGRATPASTGCRRCSTSPSCRRRSTPSPGRSGTDAWGKWIAADALYAGDAATLPTFTGNHDAGRFALPSERPFRRQPTPRCCARVELANAMLLTLRGVPTIYAGDEQGFVGTGGDQDARQDQFGSRVASYNDQPLLGTTATTATPRFDRDHPLFRQIAALARLRLATPALTRGDQRLRFASAKPGLLAVSRVDPETRQEVLLAFNTATTPLDANVQVGAGTTVATLAGSGCAARVAAPNTVRVTLPPLGYAVCAIAAMSAHPWWQGAAIYQIYLRSFADTNGDGVGDLPGVTAHLDHVARLGVDAIWLSPFYRSPQADFGYDVADYREVDPLFGSLADFDALVVRARALGLKVIVDQPWSHTSDHHPWFAASRAARCGPHADWYVWGDARPDGSPPNNWQSVFGGPAWTWDARRRQYYLHNFLSAQPQLNAHLPAVQEALLDIARFWLDRGVDGFRLDAINFLMHDPALTDNPPAPDDGRPRLRPFDFQLHRFNQSHAAIPAFLERLRALTDARPGRFTLAEVGGAEAAREMRAFTTGRPARQRLWLRLPLCRGADAGGRRRGARRVAGGCRLAELGVREPRCAAGGVALGSARTTAPASRG